MPFTCDATAYDFDPTAYDFNATAYDFNLQSVDSWHIGLLAYIYIYDADKEETIH